MDAQLRNLPQNKKGEEMHSESLCIASCVVTAYCRQVEADAQ